MATALVSILPPSDPLPSDSVCVKVIRATRYPAVLTLLVAKKYADVVPGTASLDEVDAVLPELAHISDANAVVFTLDIVSPETPQV